MRTKLVGLLVISLLVGFSSAYAAATSSNTDATESLDSHLSSPHPSIATSTAQPSSNNAGSFRRTPAPDCDGPIPSTNLVTALLSRLVRSSAVEQGKHCSMPPGPETSPYIEELHP
jgi:hypothetical protein